MGTIYRQTGRRNWMIKYYRNGRPIVESSRTDDKTEAKTLLKVREGDIAKGLPLGPKVGRVRFEEAAADVINDYTVNKRRSRSVASTRRHSRDSTSLSMRQPVTPSRALSRHGVRPVAPPANRA